MMNLNTFNLEKELSAWNDRMVAKYHGEGAIFESKNPVLRYFERSRLKDIIKVSSLSNNDKVIDVGCGEGYLLSLLPKVKQGIGVDISFTALLKAKQILSKNPKARLVLGKRSKFTVSG